MEKKKKKDFVKGILLDIGCRDRKQANFVGLDRTIREGIDVIWDWEKFPYPIETESCLTIKCAHVLEHVKPWLVIEFMDEMWRMLVPEGQLAISAPYAGSPGYFQDPTHCTPVTERTWQYFNVDAVLYEHYKPRPWKVEHLVYKPDANIEVILRKAKASDGIMNMVLEALKLGAIQKPSELGSLLVFLEKQDLGVVVEIGTSWGGVFYTFCKLARKDATLVSIDMPGGEFAGGGHVDVEKLRRYGRGKQELHFLREDSHKRETKRELVKILGKKKVDLLFIDGDHTYEGVKKDWEMYSPLVREGGFVVFHDICHHETIQNCEVERFWKEIAPKHSVAEFVDQQNTSWGGLGIVIMGGGGQKE